MKAKIPAWLVEFHEQWMNARRRRVDQAIRSFKRDWEDLLDAAGLHSASDRSAAVREATRLPQLKLHPRKGREHQILDIELPLESEAWLHDLFDSQSGAELQQQSLRVLGRWSDRRHPRLPELWNELIRNLTEAASAPHVLGPFNWREPGRIDELLGLLFQITEREWPDGTLIRSASSAIGPDSKLLEKQQSFLLRALTHLFGRETMLESLGIQTNNSILHFSGPLTLHFTDGGTHETSALRFESSIPVAELERASHITTTANQLLTVENQKTTFLQIARADQARTTLVVATSFPSLAVRELLAKLPASLPLYHFGDTDPAGYHVLAKLREVAERDVRPFLMQARPSPVRRPLRDNERSLLKRLAADSRLADMAADLKLLQDADCKGDFEQETWGAPDLPGWPFYNATAGLHSS